MSIELVLDNWEVALLVATWTVIGIVAIRRRYEWQRRRFVEQVSFSLNILIERGGSQLLLRTLLEDSANKVWLNEFGVSRVIRAARRTTQEDPFLHIADRRDREIVMVSVLNVLSERFSDAFIAQAVNLSIATEVFLYGLTWERYGEMKTQKLRVMIIKRTDLEGMFKDDESSQEISVAEESHRPRIKTLRKMFDIWNSTNEADSGMIREVELGLATPGGLRAP